MLNDGAMFIPERLDQLQVLVFTGWVFGIMDFSAGGNLGELRLYSVASDFAN